MLQLSVQILNVFSTDENSQRRISFFERRSDAQLRLNLHNFHASGLPKARPIVYTANTIPIWSHLRLKMKGNLIRNYVNFLKLELDKNHSKFLQKYY